MTPDRSNHRVTPNHAAPRPRVRHLRTTLLGCAAIGALALAACEPAATPTSNAPNAAPCTTGVVDATATSASSHAPRTGVPLKADQPAITAMTANNELAFALLKELRSTPGNMAYSPASISLALSMTYAGARGSTAQQMAKVLRLPDEPDSVHASWQTVLAGWQTPSKYYQVAVANRLFGQTNYAFEAPFLKLTETRYGAPLELRNFATSADAERKHINTWVAKQTRDRIKDLLPPASIDADTRLVLTNAIYFKGQWRTAFEKSDTSKADFHLASGKRARADMMNSTQYVRYAENDALQLAELSYQGGAFSMLVLLPKAKDGLPTLETSITSEKLAQWLASAKGEQVRVSLPRFRVAPAESVSLKATLSSMGMPDAFHPNKADFSGMVKRENQRTRLRIADVFHKAFVEVDEKGTEAAAATAVVMTDEGAMMPPENPKVFRADHPFLFMIRDTKTQTIMFVGRVDNPVSDS